MSVFVLLVSRLADLLDPVFAASATAVAIVLFTALVRVAMHPLTRAAFRGERARAALAPRIAELKRRYPGPKNADRLRKAVIALQAETKTSPLAGILPMLVQLPVFFVMYRAFSSGRVGGEVNELLGHRLFAAPLGSRWLDALGESGLLGAQGLVFLGLFAAIAAVAGWTVVRARRAGAVSALEAAGAAAAGPGRAGGRAGGADGVGGAEDPAEAMVRRMVKVMPLMAFGTLLTAAVVPLAAGLYLLTTTAWTAGERAWLQRRWDRAEAAAGAGARSSL
ncbi:YidC/Oxa1 family membrane protein insertase [Streptomyces bambusae]|uniref:YidC/Oxa1 family membrane protein insertase n=1 Tax=Streptomyces bambusae TaxID=1550616 RepID=UPI001CFD54D5|nr:membrane protein insertase YidC [Streptomyces bambusae]MCB5167225.1 YidC/Oxa1 family membrane protein insertase [Streptomyces bambusae]